MKATIIPKRDATLSGAGNHVVYNIEDDKRFMSSSPKIAEMLKANNKIEVEYTDDKHGNGRISQATLLEEAERGEILFPQETETPTESKTKQEKGSKSQFEKLNTRERACANAANRFQGMELDAGKEEYYITMLIAIMEGKQEETREIKEKIAQQSIENIKEKLDAKEV